MRKMKNILYLSRNSIMREPAFSWFDKIMYCQDNIRCIQFKDQKIYDVHLLQLPPKLAPPAVPVRYPYNLCLHTVSIMVLNTFGED